MVKGLLTTILVIAPIATFQNQHRVTPLVRDTALQEEQNPEHADLRLEHAEVPMYPQMARIAHIFGTVAVKVTVKDGLVVGTEVIGSAHPILVRTAQENIKTWRFHDSVRTTFTTKFVYQLQSKKSKERFLADPKIELQLPFLVRITSVPPILDQAQFGIRDGR